MNVGLKHIVFDLGAVLFAWQPRQMLMREVLYLAPHEKRAAQWAQEIFLVGMDKQAPNVAAAQALGWCALQFHGAAEAAAALRANGWAA